MPDKTNVRDFINLSVAFFTT
ncbi:unnamed protein product [Larinioides sclopetarius]|uniref:Uncharacterized protein n=1 Tax=Larinioides sclopetarius TaxID=280406 RepID=A0AAV2AZA3_9ARAC